jgi:hypothetical protein
VPDACGAPGGINSQLPSLADIPRLIAQHELQLGPPDFNPELQKYSGSLPGFHLILQPMLGF